MSRPDKWRPTDGLVLEPNAFRAATEQSRSLALTAGPGAGKTEMLAQRADFLLRTGLCRYPHRILAISFKVDASRNLRDRVRSRCGTELASRFDSHTFQAFAKRIIDRFRPVLTGTDALDPDYKIGPARIQRTTITFGDLVPLAIEILRRSSIALNAVRQTYTHVFLDEFQDCTDEQYRLVKTAFGGTAIHLTAVGDTKQRIMGWAGALEGIYLRYAQDFNALGLNLYQNFRSLPKLRRMQNRMIAVLEPSAALDEDEIDGDEGEISVVHFSDSLEEAEAVASSIQRWATEDAIPYAEIAVLVPKQPDLYCGQLMEELRRRNVPFRNESDLQDLSAEPIARLLVDFLLVISGDREPDAYARLMAIINLASPDEDDERRYEWQQFVADHRKDYAQLEKVQIENVRSLAESFLQELGAPFVAGLAAEYEQGSYLTAKIEETINRIAALLDEIGELSEALSRFSDDRAVRILTIHKSKGLEFDSVVLLGVEKEAYWGKIADERAAFFVGISRAKRRLVLTSVDVRPRPPGATKRWDEDRTEQAEFLGYAAGL